jgi:hypothetical protein
MQGPNPAFLCKRKTSRVLAVSGSNRDRDQRLPDLGHAAPGDFSDVFRRHTARGALSLSTLR